MRTPNFFTDVVRNQSAENLARNSGLLKIIYHGIAVDIADPSLANRVRVYVPELDSNVKTEDDIKLLFWCAPILPSHLTTLPIVGEHVLMIPASPSNPHVDRFWIGPQLGNYNYSGESFIQSVSRYLREG